jgi:serralysin
LPIPQAAETAVGEGIDHLVSIEDVIGSAFADRIMGDGGDNQLNGGGSNDTLVGGTGHDGLIGGGGRDTFIFAPTDDSDIIRDFQPGTDVIDVHGYGFADFAALAAVFEASGHDTLLHLATDQGLVVGVAVDHLTADDFALA